MLFIIALLISSFICESSINNCTKIVGTVQNVIDKSILVSYNVDNEEFIETAPIPTGDTYDVGSDITLYYDNDNPSIITTRDNIAFKIEGVLVIALLLAIVGYEPSSMDKDVVKERVHI